MSYPTRPSAGPAQPVSIVTSGVTQGGVAIPVYGYSSQPTDRPVLGGPSQRVKVLSSSDLIQNGGTYRLAGNSYAVPVFTAPSGLPVMGGPSIAIYPVNTNGWPYWYAGAVVAYQPKGAASLAASYSNLANPGVNDAAPGIAPTWDATNGWIFDGVTQYLTTMVYSSITVTVLIRYSGAVWHPSFRVLFGSYSNHSPFQNISFTEYSDNLVYWDNNGENAPGLTGGAYAAGVTAIAGQKGFFDGVFKVNIPANGSGVTNTAIFINGANADGVITARMVCNIQAMAIYSSVLTNAQVASVSAAMALL